MTGSNQHLRPIIPVTSPGAAEQTCRVDVREIANDEV
jgi:hypothetical protein